MVLPTPCHHLHFFFFNFFFYSPIPLPANSSLSSSPCRHHVMALAQGREGLFVIKPTFLSCVVSGTPKKKYDSRDLLMLIFKSPMKVEFSQVEFAG